MTTANRRTICFKGDNLANLLPIANRMNDIEISNDAILSTTLNRRYGQNINYFMDLFGVADGDTTPTGFDEVRNFNAALTLVRNHTIQLVHTVPTDNISQTLGTFTTIPYVNAWLWSDRPVVAGGSTGSRLVPIVSTDGNPFRTPDASVRTPSSTTPLGANLESQYQKSEIGPQIQNGMFSPGITDPAAGTFDGFYGNVGYERQMSEQRIGRALKMDWRDGLTHTVIYYNENFQGTQFWLTYEIGDIESVGFTW